MNELDSNQTTKTGVTAFVDRSALVHNCRRIASLVAPAKVLAVVKSDAYGHGNFGVCAAIKSEVDGLAVARVPEARQLCADASIAEMMILVMNGAGNKEELRWARQAGIALVVHTKEQLKDVAELGEGKMLNVWMKLDTGLHRLGFHPEEARDRYNELRAIPWVQKPVTIMSHLGTEVGAAPGPLTAQQMEVFRSFLAEEPKLPRSLMASQGVLDLSDHYEFVRPGTCLYGYHSNVERFGKEVGLRPAMRLTTRLLARRTHKAGQGVNYCLTWKSTRDTQIGVIAAGTGDGIPRTGSGVVWINGRICPIVGAVAMDLLSVDLGPDATDEEGSLVELFGPNLPLERVCDLAGTFPAALLAGLTERVNKVYI